MSNPIEITRENFDEVVLKSEVPVLVDFWAPWCGPCRTMGPIVDEIAEETPSIVVGKINVDENQDLAMQYGIMSIPTLVFIKNGKLEKTLVGLRDKQELISVLEQM